MCRTDWSEKHLFRIAKGILKRKTAKILVSRLLELPLQKKVQIFEYLISEACMTSSRKGASSDLLQRLD